MFFKTTIISLYAVSNFIVYICQFDSLREVRHLTDDTWTNRIYAIPKEYCKL